MAAIDAPADWLDFVSETSMHGIRFIHMKTIAVLRRVLWFIFTLGVLVFFSYIAYGLIKQYVDKNLVTKVKVQRATELPFPTITICNQNMWRGSELNASSQSLGTNALFTIFDDLYGVGGELPPPAGKYDWENDPDLATIAGLRTNDTDNFLQHAAHTLAGTFLMCSLEGVPVNCSETLAIIPTDQGYCFQFNSAGDLQAKSPGKTGGIQFILDAQTEEYSTGPFSVSEGFAVVLHEAHEVPLVTELSYGVAPGFQSSFALSKSLYDHYPPPADGGKSNCFNTNTKPNPLHYYTANYTYSACIVECKTAYVINKGGCREMLQPALNNTDLCLLPSMLNCSQPAIRSFVSDPDGLSSCDCADPCIESQYSATVTNYKFPSRNGIKNQQIASLASVEYMRDNIVMLDLFYNKMSFEKITEEPAIDELSLISNIGGILGLCVGASFLTFYEFIEFIFLRLYRCCKREQKVTDDIKMTVKS